MKNIFDFKLFIVKFKHRKLDYFLILTENTPIKSETLIIFSKVLFKKKQQQQQTKSHLNIF